MLRVDRPEVALAGPEHDGDDVHAHLVHQAGGERLTTDIAGGDLDKPEIAARVAWSGAGINLRTGTPSAAQIAEAVGRMNADPAYGAAARRIADELAEAGGSGRAAEFLEGMLEPGGAGGR